VPDGIRFLRHSRNRARCRAEFSCWYAIARSNCPELADQYIQEIEGLGIKIVEVDWALTRQAAAFKANGNISYADCFAAALAKLEKAELVTGDQEFKALGGEIKIAWV